MSATVPTVLIEYQVKGGSLLERFLHGVFSQVPMIEEYYHSYEHEMYGFNDFMVSNSGKYFSFVNYYFLSCTKRVCKAM